MLKLENICYSHGDEEVFKNLSLFFASASTNAILGPSGCGKTTLLRLIAGFETPASGTIYIDDKAANSDSGLLLAPNERGVGFVFQDLALWPHMSVYENIAFGMRENGVENIEQTIDEYLALFGIEDKKQKFPHQLSGGQKQMVAIIRTVVLSPSILLMDEPMANIDMWIKKEIFAQLEALQKRERFTLLYVTHDHHEAFGIAKNILIMKRGKVIAGGTKDEIESFLGDVK